MKPWQRLRSGFALIAQAGDDVCEPLTASVPAVALERWADGLIPDADTLAYHREHYAAERRAAGVKRVWVKRLAR